MVKWTDVTNTSVQVHRLVQEITCGRLAEEERRFCLDQALRLVDAAIPAEPQPDDIRSWPMWDGLWPHVAAVATQADQVVIAAPTARLLNELGLFLQTKCVFVETESLYRRALVVTEAAYGPTHPEVATYLNNLAQLLQDINRPAEAEPLLRRVVSIFKHFNDSTGHEHPRWRAALANYGALLQAMSLSQEEITQRLQDVAAHSAPRSESI